MWYASCCAKSHFIIMFVSPFGVLLEFDHWNKQHTFHYNYPHCSTGNKCLSVRMRMMSGGWSKWMAGRHRTACLSRHRTASIVGVHRPNSTLCTVPQAAGSPSQSYALTTTQPVHRVCVSRWLHQCWQRRCLHTGETNDKWWWTKCHFSSSV